jgi:adenylate cyclase
MASPEPDRGRKVDTIRRLLAKKAAEIIRNDPDEAALALEIGLVDDRWLEDPLNNPISTSKPTEIIEQFLERSVERRPSLFSSLGLSAVQLLTSHRGMDDGETKVLAIVFTDLEGFTAYTDEHGDAAAVALVEEQHRAASPIVRRRRGKVVKHLGDGLLCTFNDPDGAIRASLEMLETSPPPLRLRAGIHMGEVIVSRGDVVGQVVNIAARITESVKGDQVVVSADTADAAGEIPGVEFKKLRARRLKGISERVQLREAVTVRPGTSRTKSQS